MSRKGMLSLLADRCLHLRVGVESFKTDDVIKVCLDRQNVKWLPLRIPQLLH